MHRELRAASYETKASHHGICTCAHVHRELRAANYETKALKTCGFTLEELKEGGCVCTHMHMWHVHMHTR